MRTFVFTATVRGLDAGEENPSSGEEGGVRWQLTLDVDRVYAGNVRDRFLLRGSTSEGGIGYACGYFLGDRVSNGDVLLIALDELIPIESNDSLFGNLLLWRQTGGGWEFYESALQDGDEPAAYPTAAREATSLAEILAVLDHLAMPETATEPAPQDVAPWNMTSVVLLVCMFGVAGLLVRRRGQRRT